MKEGGLPQTDPQAPTGVLLWARLVRNNTTLPSLETPLISSN